MKIWIVCGLITNTEGWEQAVQAGDELLKKNGVEVNVYRRTDIVYTVGGDGESAFYAKGEKTEIPDKVLLYGHCDDALEGIEDALTAAGVKSINPIAAKRVSCSKLKTAQLLSSEDLPQAKTMPVFRNTPVDLIIKEIGLPLVMKPDLGYGGEGIRLIENEKELISFMDGLPEKPTEVMLAQKYISTSKGRDLRVVLLNGKVYAAMVRKAADPNEFRSNVHQGGQYEEYTLTEDIISLCEKAAKLSGLGICGIDLLFGDDGFIIGEINDSPGIKTLVEKAGFRKFLQGILA